MQDAKQWQVLQHTIMVAKYLVNLHEPRPVSLVLSSVTDTTDLSLCVLSLPLTKQRC